MEMQLYAIRRRNISDSQAELDKVAQLSKKVGDEEMSDQVRWIRSYVVEEPGGKFGTICIYQATDEDALREHARRVGLPADEIEKVLDTVVIRPDP